MSKEVVPIDDLTITSAREGPIHIRVKVLQYTTMLKLFSQIMEEYNNSMLRYNEKCRLLLYQQKLLSTFFLKIEKYIFNYFHIIFTHFLVRKHITSEELEKLLDIQENNIFVDNVRIKNLSLYNINFSKIKINFI